MLDPVRPSSEKVDPIIHDIYAEVIRSNDRDSFQYRMKRMAVEVIESFVKDILTVGQIRKYVNIGMEKNASVNRKFRAQLMLQRHYRSVSWFSGGSAKKSIWFEILGLESMSQETLMKLIHRRVEGHANI